MATKESKTYILAEMKDKYIGEVGTAERDEYEYTSSAGFIIRPPKTADLQSARSRLSK